MTGSGMRGVTGFKSVGLHPAPERPLFQLGGGGATGRKNVRCGIPPFGGYRDERSNRF